MQGLWTGQRIIFVSGKGGVGKSLIAAAIARRETRAGRRVLLAEIGDTSYYKDFWQMPHIGHDPVALPSEGFDVALWNGESCLREYVLYYLRLQRLYTVFFENKVMKSLIGVAPGLNEIAILGKITSGVRKIGPPLPYDVIVVDSYATGHMLALLLAPRGMMEAIKFGPMGHHSREIERTLQNPEISSYLAVTLLEEMPVVETLEFRDHLKKELGVSTEVIANKLLPMPVSDQELKNLENQDPAGLGEFAKYLLAIQDRQKTLLEQLRAAVGQVLSVPFVFSAEPEVLVRETGEALRQA